MRLSFGPKSPYPHKGPPRPIRLALKKSGKLEPLDVN